LYRERIKEYWGIYPHEIYGCTEVGIMAIQAWDHQDLNFIPSTAFYEFIPEHDWAAERLQGTPPSETLLMDQLEVGKRYEVVIRNFYGGPFLRYRMHDLVEVTSLSNDKLGIRLPQFRFAGRSGDFIDLSGFAGLIDERQITMVLGASEIRYVDWVVCKEIYKHQPVLHFYMELAAEEGARHDDIAQRVHDQLGRLNRDYADIEKMLGFTPLMVTLLNAGTFNRYMKYQVERGADLAHLKPARIEPRPEALEMLLSKSGEGANQ
jgi:phenylacetate-coenzyme A ligase PaaK-like adenylate-forming protein